LVWKNSEFFSLRKKICWVLPGASFKLVFNDKKNKHETNFIIDDDCFTEEESIRAGFATQVWAFLAIIKMMGWSILEARHCWLYRLIGTEKKISLVSLFEGLENTYFSPVLIYSAHSWNFGAVKDSGQYFSRKLNSWGCKRNFSDIRTQVESWLNKIRQQNFQVFYQEVTIKIHKTFWA